MLELLNQLDGFQPNSDIKVIAATNRVDILDPALLRSGRLDRKIEFPHPNEEARARIMQIHSRKMNVSKDVNYEELARCTDDFNGAQCKAVCIEAVRHLIYSLIYYLNHTYISFYLRVWSLWDVTLPKSHTKTTWTLFSRFRPRKRLILTTMLKFSFLSRVLVF